MLDILDSNLLMPANEKNKIKIKIEIKKPCAWKKKCCVQYVVVMLKMLGIVYE